MTQESKSKLNKSLNFQQNYQTYQSKNNKQYDNNDQNNLNIQMI